MEQVQRQKWEARGSGSWIVLRSVAVVQAVCSQPGPSGLLQ